MVIKKNDIWEMVNLLEGKSAIGLKLVFKTQCYADGSVKRHKAQLVVKMYAQKHGVDFEESFSSIARFGIMRIILSLDGQLR